MLDRAGERFLGVEREHLPLGHDRRAIPFAAVGAIDQSTSSST